MLLVFQAGVVLGLRGGVAFEVEAQTVGQDLHSGLSSWRSMPGFCFIRAQKTALSKGHRIVAILHVILYMVHSAGLKGGSVQNPIHALAQFVADLHAPNGSVAVDGFYE